MFTLLCYEITYKTRALPCLARNIMLSYDAKDLKMW